MNKKSLYLFLGLLLPVLVFLFLKFFGRNSFDVPLLFQQPIQAPEGCDRSYSHPYVLEDSVFKSFGVEQGLVLIDFSKNGEELARVVVDYDKIEIKVVSASDMKISDEQNQYLKQCILLLAADQDLALIDQKKQIRGQYTSTDRDEMDRLQAELKILLKRY